MLSSVETARSFTVKILAIEAFYLPKKIEGAERTVSQAAEAVRARAARLERDAEDVAKWLAAKSE